MPMVISMGILEYCINKWEFDRENDRKLELLLDRTLFVLGIRLKEFSEIIGQWMKNFLEMQRERGH